MLFCAWSEHCCIGARAPQDGNQVLTSWQWLSALKKYSRTLKQAKCKERRSSQYFEALKRAKSSRQLIRTLLFDSLARICSDSLARSQLLCCCTFSCDASGNAINASKSKATLLDSLIDRTGEFECVPNRIDKAPGQTPACQDCSSRCCASLHSGHAIWA